MMAGEMILFGLGVGAGLFLAGFYDLERAFRKSIRHSDKAVALEDLLFWTVTAAVLFGLLEQYNRGILRMYLFLGCGCGMWIYWTFLTRILLTIFFGLFQGLGWVLGKILFFLRKIRKFVGKMLILPLKNLWERIKIIHNNI